MSRTSDVSVLLSGVALGATAIFFADEKNRARAKAAVLQLVAETKELSAQWQEDPDKVIAQFKQKASDIAQQLEDSSKATGKKLSDASKKQMIAALDETDVKIKAARQSLATQTTEPVVKESKETKSTQEVKKAKKPKTTKPTAAQPKSPEARN